MKRELTGYLGNWVISLLLISFMDIGKSLKFSESQFIYI